MDGCPENDKLSRVMVVAAHPDDAEFGCGGTVARWTRQGKEVRYAVCTAGNRGTKDLNMSPYQLAETREREQLAAARTLGVVDVTFLRHEDGELEPTKELRDEIALLIRKYRPQIIFTHDAWKPYQLHPDHRAVGISTIDAIVAARDHLFLPGQTAIGLEASVTCEVYLWTAHEQDYFEDITDTFELKLEALGKHVSQLEHRPGWQDRVRNWAVETGKQAGTKYAEAFKFIKLR